MERKLYVIMTIGGVMALLFGAALVALNPDWLGYNWLRVKLLLVAGLVGFHIYCRRLMSELARGEARSQTWYRWFNEVPALALLGIVILVVVKPSF